MNLDLPWAPHAPLWACPNVIMGGAHDTPGLPMKLMGMPIRWKWQGSYSSYHGHAQGPFLHIMGMPKVPFSISWACPWTLNMGMPMDPKHGHAHGLLCHSMGMPMATFALAWACPWSLFVQDGWCPCPPLHQHGHAHDWQKCCVIWISKGLVFMLI